MGTPLMSDDKKWDQAEPSFKPFFISLNEIGEILCYDWRLEMEDGSSLTIQRQNNNGNSPIKANVVKFAAKVMLAFFGKESTIN
uniref:Uncharacterized protein n=1 Tax=Romanomermis culicivorax TaxID=13658 RepID=A0A915I685_ROMCU